MVTCWAASCWAWSISSLARRRLPMRSARSRTASTAGGIDITRMAIDTGSIILSSLRMVLTAVVASAGPSVISWPQSWAMASRLRLAAPRFSLVALSSWMIMSAPLLRRRVQQLVDLLDHVGPAELGGGGPAGFEHLAGLVGLAFGHKQLAQCDA